MFGDMKKRMFDFRNRHEIKILGVPKSPCVRRFCGPFKGPLQALTHHKFQKQF